MIVLTLKPGKHTSKLISKFNQFLEFNNLRVMAQRQNSETNNIEVEINAQYFTQVQRATSLAQRFFTSNVISIKAITPTAGVNMPTATVINNVTNIGDHRPAVQTGQQLDRQDQQIDIIAA